jgi:hypothetical protein
LCFLLICSYTRHECDAEMLLEQQDIADSADILPAMA